MSQLGKTLVADSDVAWDDVEPNISRKIMSYTEGVMLVKVAFEAGGIGATHKHPHLQMSYIASGAFEVTVGDDKKILREGDVYYIPSDVLHGVVCLEKGVLVDVFTPMREDFVS